MDQGWGPGGIRIAALGGFKPGVAAMRTGQIDGMMSSVEGGLTLEEKKMAATSPICRNPHRISSPMSSSRAAT